MKANFKVKNFGPITNAELDLRNVNVFIGPQSSGKSTLAKLYTICKSPLSFLEDDDLRLRKELAKNNDNGGKSYEALKFESALRDLNIHNFLTPKSEVEFESETHHFRYVKGKIEFKRKFEVAYRVAEEAIISKNLSRANEIVKSFANKIWSFKLTLGLECYQNKYGQNIPSISAFNDFMKQYDYMNHVFSEKSLNFLIEELEIEELNLLSSMTNYIPAERIIIPILKGATFNLLNNNIPIPKHILNFASIYEKAISVISELDLGFIKDGLKFKIVNGKERVFFSSRKSVALLESATGIQSLVPLLMTINFDPKYEGNISFVIEEPEINLFPKAQYSLMKSLERNRWEGVIDNTSTHTITTHSPYILSAFNNMLYAFKRSEQVSEEQKEDLDKILPKENWLNPENFNAYSVQDGTAVQILDRELGLIGENVIDQISDEMSDDFDRMMSI